MSDFEKKLFSLVWFSIKICTTCQTLDNWIRISKTCQIFSWRKTTHHILKLKNFDMSYFKRVRRNKSHLFFFLRENNRLSNFRDFLKKKWFWFRILPHVSFWTDEKDIASDFKKMQYKVLDIEVKNNALHSEI